jgi:tetratricopeptide (TPR) repeat protein
MKKVLLTLALAILGQFAIAQNMQVQNAFAKQKEAQQFIDQAEALKTQHKTEKAAKQMQNAKITITKAKEAIDAASVHESTMNQAKTWHYYAVIYYKIGAYPEFVDIDPDSYDKVLSAIEKIQQIDENYYRQMGEELSSYVRGIDNTYYQLGVDSFNNGNYEDAMANFQKATEASSKIGAVDDAAMMACATCAIKLGKFDVAAETFRSLIDKGYEDVTNYSGLINAYRELGEGEKSIEVINIAREKYADNPQIINDMINTYLTLHRESEIVDQIEAMAVKYTEQPVYYYILGNIYSNMDSEIFDIEKALEYYGKVIAEDPNYADAYYGAGVLLMNKAAEIAKEADDKDPSQYANFNAYLDATDKLAADAKAYNERALPYMEKAYELLPNDEAVKHALKTLYTRLKQMDKAKELD